MFGLVSKECYTAFCSHITCEAIYNENLVPVTNRRCLCELAKEIGFMDQAQKIFSLEEQLSTFRHLVTVALKDISSICCVINVLATRNGQERQ